jgi:TP901 family phage tail tape measure protein
MALNTMGLGFLFTARDEASNVVRKLERCIGSLGDKTDSVMLRFTQGAIGVGIMAGGIMSLRSAFSMAKEAGSFEQVLMDVKAIAGGTTADLKTLHDAAIQAGLATQFGPQESAKGLRDLAAAGYDAADSVKLLNPVLMLAQGSLGELNPAMAGEALVQTLKAFKLGAEDAGLAVDKLVKASNMSSLKPKEIPLAVGRVARGATLFGADETEALASVGMARNIIGSVEMAATGVSVAMERLVKPKFQKALKGIGVDVVDKATGGFRKFLDILTDITGSAAFNKMSKAEQSAFFYNVFGSRGAGAANAILTQLSGGIKNAAGDFVKGVDAVQYWRKSLDGASGEAENFSREHLNNLAGQLDLLSSAWKTLRVQMGETFGPVVKGIVITILDVVRGIGKALKELSPETAHTLGALALGAGALVTAFGAFAAMKFGIAGLSLVFGALGVSLSSVLAGFIPVIAIFAAVTAAGILLYEAYKTNFGGFADFVDSAAKKVVLAIKGLGQLFSSGEFSGAVMTDIDKLENGGVKSFVITLYMWGSRIKNFFVGIGEGFARTYEVLKPTFAGLVYALDGLASAFGMNVGAADENLNSWERFGSVGEKVGQVLGDLLTGGIWLVTEGVKALTMVIGAGQDAWKLYGDIVSSTLQIAAGAIELVYGALTGRSETFWEGFIDLTFGAVKTVVNLLYGLAKSFAYVFDTMNGYMDIKSDFIPM